MPRLDVYLDSDLVFQIQMKDEAFWIGRGSDCLVSLNDPQVSHRHAHLSPGGEGWQIRNEGRNGTRLNANQLTDRAPLKYGDRIYIGKYAMVFQNSDAPALRADLDTPTSTSNR